MSTEPRSRTRGHRRRSRRFVAAFGATVAVLAVVSASGAALTTAQGPRVTSVEVDPQAAAEASGSRMVVTTTQSLSDVDADQVTVTPETPFTVDTSGRSVGVRFTLPLYDETEYTVQIEGLEGVGGGPVSDVTETFTTPPLEIYLLRRGGEGDTIFRTDLGGENAVPVFTHPHIEDFRATTSHLAVSVRTDDDAPAIIVTDLDGENPQQLALPGDGYLTNLQSADRGDVVGYTYSDRDPSAPSALDSALFTGSLKDPDAAPVPATVAGGDPRVDDWRFVPDTDALLLLTFDSRLQLTAAGGSGPVDLGAAIAIDGIARGSSVAVVERAEGMTAVDLSDGSEQPLVLSPDSEDGSFAKVTPLPGAGAGTLQTFTLFDGLTSLGTTIQVVSAAGEPRTVFEAPAEDAVLQTCVSPSGRYAAVLVAPDVVANPYDSYELPLPEDVETHLVDLTEGEPVIALSGFDVSWCQVPPR
jgi:hypothetical protein